MAIKPSHAAPPPELAPSIEALQDKLLQTYLAGLRDDNPRVPKKAARGLGYLGRAAAEAVPALRALCDDEHRAVQQVGPLGAGEIQLLTTRAALSTQS